MAEPVTILSPTHLHTLRSSLPTLILDFHATWCGPCHAIAPIYASLAKQYATPSFGFAKVDVDQQQAIAREYGVTAMPTFVVLREGKVVETVRGANAKGLKEAVENAKRLGDREEEVRRVERERKQKAEREVKEQAQEANEVSVGGSYGITKGSGWKMSLR